MSKAILYDSTLCIGCKACEGACAERWGLPYNDQIAAEQTISAHKLTAVETHGDKFCRRLCMNCLQPTCVSVCPVGALQKTALGPVTYDADKCMGCRYCMQACPFQLPTYEWSKRLPKMRKCNMCYERQSAGKQTACAEVCPVGATVNGDRDELIREAKRRIGDRVCMIGGFDQFHWLAGCTPEATRAAVRRCFEQAGEGGGYILAPSDHFFDAELELLEAFADEARQCVYGQ